MEQHPAFITLVKVTIFTLMLAIGVTHSFGHLISLWRSPRLLLRGLLAVVVLVPAAVIVLLYVLDLPHEVATGLAVLAAAPGAPLTTKRSEMAGSNLAHAASLQLTLALLAVLITPLTLALFHGLFDLDTENLRPRNVARQVAMVQLLPVGIGLLLQRVGGGISSVIGRPLVVLANVLFIVLVLLLLVPALRIIVQIGLLPMAAIVVMAGFALAVGHLLGGPRPDDRAALAVASVARNIGLALFVATLGGVQKLLIPTLVTYMILGALVAMPYSVWSRRHIARLAGGSGG